MGSARFLISCGSESLSLRATTFRNPLLLTSSTTSSSTMSNFVRQSKVRRSPLQLSGPILVIRIGRTIRGPQGRGLKIQLRTHVRSWPRPEPLPRSRANERPKALCNPPAIDCHSFERGRMGTRRSSMPSSQVGFHRHLPFRRCPATPTLPPVPPRVRGPSQGRGDVQKPSSRYDHRRAVVRFLGFVRLRHGQRAPL